MTIGVRNGFYLVGRQSGMHACQIPLCFGRILNVKHTVGVHVAKRQRVFQGIGVDAQLADTDLFRQLCSVKTKHQLIVALYQHAEKAVCRQLLRKTVFCQTAVLRQGAFAHTARLDVARCQIPAHVNRKRTLVAEYKPHLFAVFESFFIGHQRCVALF